MPGGINAKMAFKEVSPKLQLSFEEYTETWLSVLNEYYAQALGDKITSELVGKDNDSLVAYSLEMGTVLLIIAMRHWQSSKRFTEAVRQKVTDKIVSAFYSGLPGNDSQELQDEYLRFFRVKSNIFLDLCPGLGGRNAEKQKMELVGMSRYLVAQVSNRPEKDNQRIIEQVGMILMKAAAAFSMLAANSSPNPQMIGKPRFIVQK